MFYFQKYSNSTLNNVKIWVASNTPCFDISKMCSAVFVPSELTEILRYESKFENFKYNRRSGAHSGIWPGPINFFYLSRGGGAQHPLGHENPLKSIDFTGPGASWIRPCRRCLKSPTVLIKEFYLVYWTWNVFMYSYNYKLYKNQRLIAMTPTPARK